MSASTACSPSRLLWMSLIMAFTPGSPRDAAQGRGAGIAGKAPAETGYRRDVRSRPRIGCYEVYFSPGKGVKGPGKSPPDFAGPGDVTRRTVISESR